MFIFTNRRINHGEELCYDYKLIIIDFFFFKSLKELTTVQRKKVI